jgi:predicted nucleic acid-binding protein
MILVDTDVWIDFFAGVDPGASAVSALLHQKRAMVSSISAFELFSGVRTRSQEEQVETLIYHVPPLTLTVEAARQAAHHYRRLKRSGLPIGNQDLLLAGTALEYGLPLLTRNRKLFARVEGLEVLSPEEIDPVQG